MTTDFRARVLHVVNGIPEGRVIAYGAVATLAGAPRAARAVGNILRGLTPADGDVPWQRVVNAKRTISFKGDPTRAGLQRRRLEAEGVRFDAAGVIDAAHAWAPSEAPSFIASPPTAVPATRFEPPPDWEDG